MNQNSRTDDGALVARGCQVKGFYVTGDGSNKGRVIFYDNDDAASGTVLAELRCGADETASIVLPSKESLSAHVGVYVDITTVGRTGVLYD